MNIGRKINIKNKKENNYNYKDIIIKNNYNKKTNTINRIEYNNN